MQSTSSRPIALTSPARLTAGVLLGGVGWVFAIATIAGFAGSWWWPFDLVANWRPQLMIVLLVLGAAHATFFGRASGLAFLAAALINFFAVAPLFLSATPDAAEGAPELTIVSFNVQASNPLRGEVMQYLASTDADVIFLLESSFEWENAVRAANLPYVMVAEVPGDRRFGITYLARPGIDTAAIGLDLSISRALGATVEFAGQDVAMLALHPLSPTSGARADARDDLMNQAAEWAEARTGPKLVIGDLNSSPWSHAFRNLTGKGDLRNSLKGYGLQPSWPVGWGPLMIPIDHALLSEELIAVDRTTGPNLGSDHRPLVVTIAFRDDT